MPVTYQLHTWGGPASPEHPRDDVGWAKWAEEHRAWRTRMDALLSTAIFALDTQIIECALPGGECEVCDLSDEARAMLYATLSPEGKKAVDTVRALLPIVEAVVE